MGNNRIRVPEGINICCYCLHFNSTCFCTFGQEFWYMDTLCTWYNLLTWGIKNKNKKIFITELCETNAVYLGYIRRIRKASFQPEDIESSAYSIKLTGQKFRIQLLMIYLEWRHQMNCCRQDYRSKAWYRKASQPKDSGEVCRIQCHTYEQVKPSSIINDNNKTLIIIEMIKQKVQYNKYKQKNKKSQIYFSKTIWPNFLSASVFRSPIGSTSTPASCTSRSNLK